jgi:hypothetical protein
MLSSIFNGDDKVAGSFNLIFRIIIEIERLVRFVYYYYMPSLSFSLLISVFTGQAGVAAN